ncbi:MAG: diguanylate cyclase [Nitrospirae bacterium]|nr:diguanylate cyclase [Nitrospirota bacterium]
MPAMKEKNFYRTFIISTGLVIALVLSGIFLDMVIRTRQLMNEENIIQARVVFNTLVLTRTWNANYGGVYVEKKKGVESNPYLINPDIKTVDGRVFTLRNPAFMTRELSEYAENEGMFKFHITSLKLMNPHNEPDEFEKKALLQFESGAVKEVSGTELVNNRTYFRYMAPLYIKNDCLQCHKHQNYAVGDVRGGISITFDIEDRQRKIRSNTITIVLFGIVTTLFLLGLIYFFMARLIKRFDQACQTIEKIAITDALTELFNRHHIMLRFEEEFEKFKRLKMNVSCILIDVDNFKAINDSYGHQIGDQVLQVISARMRDTIRAYDILGRYGGEEFLIILPDTSLEDARGLAERIRTHVKEETVNNATVTLSLGVVCVQASDRSVDDIIRRADEHLYKAKMSGRDRVSA